MKYLSCLILLDHKLSPPRPNGLKLFGNPWGRLFNFGNPKSWKTFISWWFGGVSKGCEFLKPYPFGCFKFQPPKLSLCKRATFGPQEPWKMKVLGPKNMGYYLGDPPSQDASHHQDYCIFSRGSLLTFICHCYWEGGQPKLLPLKMKVVGSHSGWWIGYWPVILKIPPN